MTNADSDGLALYPFRALRYQASAQRLGRLLCPPYDVIDTAQRARLLETEPDNAVAVILPEADGGADPYQDASERLETWARSGLVVPDDTPAIYVYEMRTSDGSTARGMLGAIELRDPADGVILPHENTMAGPVADRLALMSATQTNLEPIYLVYDGGGPASAIVAAADLDSPIQHATTPDGTTHRLWAITDPTAHAEIAKDLGGRRALIADGHHRYATYRELQAQKRAGEGSGPWDRGLALLVDSSTFGPTVHAIHRVLEGAPLASLVEALSEHATADAIPDLALGLRELDNRSGFAAVLSDGDTTFVISDPHDRLRELAGRDNDPPALSSLDVTVLHKALVERVWGIEDTVESVGYAHSIEEAVDRARASHGTAVLMRPTPIAAVAAVAAAGARMPRKSTLFTPKPASGLVMRRFSDER